MTQPTNLTQPSVKNISGIFLAPNISDVDDSLVAEDQWENYRTLAYSQMNPILVLSKEGVATYSDGTYTDVVVRTYYTSFGSCIDVEVYSLHDDDLMWDETCFATEHIDEILTSSDPRDKGCGDNNTEARQGLHNNNNNNNVYDMVCRFFNSTSPTEESYKHG